MNNSSNPSRRDRYTRMFYAHGEGPKALQWANYKAAAIRYRELVQDINFNDKSILDAGCGMGDLLPFIYATGAQNFNYLGVDLTEVFIDVASKRFDGHKFRVADPFTDRFKDAPFDIVISSGVMNNNSADWLEKRKKMIAALYKLASEAVAFNMAGGVTPDYFSDASKVAYASSEEIIAFCKTLTPRIIMRVHYHLKDFTIILFKYRYDSPNCLRFGRWLNSSNSSLCSLVSLVGVSTRRVTICGPRDSPLRCGTP